MTLRVAVVGYGKLGTIHARLIDEHPGFSLVAVIDPLDKNRRDAAANL
ncbi:MAG: hypothetical protein HOB20_12310, partial [Planctomycetaceae bacterium]|nr:hypothetical protein [Planctomycetaceae bacterium]